MSFKKKRGLLYMENVTMHVKMHVQVKFPCSGQQEMLPESQFFTLISHNVNR